MARRAGDPLAETVALDELTAVQLARGELHAALASALRRTEILGTLPVTALSGLEHSDSLQMATECATAAGDLRTARQLAERVRDLPFHREEGHLATARLIVVATLAGDWDEVLVLAGQFREGWERAGRPRAGNLTRSAYAAATVHGLRGDDDARAAWLEIVDALATPARPLSTMHFNEFFDALLLLHRGQGEGEERCACGLGARPLPGGLQDLGPAGNVAAARARPPVGTAPGWAAPRPVGRRVPLSWARTLVATGGPNGPGEKPSWPRWAQPSWPGLQDEVERGLGGPAHAAEARLAQQGRQPPLAGLRAEPRPTSWSSDPGVQITVDRPKKVRPTGFRFSSSPSPAIGSTGSSVPSGARAWRTRRAAPTGSPMSCRQSNMHTRS